MRVNPFYVKVDSSTRKNQIGVGVKSKKGFMTTQILQRSDGEITTPFTIEQRSAVNDKGEVFLYCYVYDKHGHLIAQEITNY